MKILKGGEKQNIKSLK